MTMIKKCLHVALVLATVWSLGAQAALKVGASAPDVVAPAALGGKLTQFNLAQALKRGPVVLYFYPKAFTSGCTVEAHLFAEAMPQFEALRATVVGMSNDNIETLQKFSLEECRSKFAVAADDGARFIKQYDVGLMLKPDMADRVSYVIGQDGRIAFVHVALSPEGHVVETLKAVQKLQAR